MLFSDEFIESLRTDPISGAIQISDIVRSHLTGASDSDFVVLAEAYSLVLEMIETGLLPPMTGSVPMVSGKVGDDLSAISAFLGRINDHVVAQASKLRVESMRSRFGVALRKGFVYEFSQGDLDRVQLLINELRTQISTSKALEKEHQQRLLRRLERLQAELHKRVADLDRFWGLIGDAGVVLGKLGTDAKPIVDRIREIADIVWQTQSRAEELPSGTDLPLLEQKPDGKVSDA